MFLVGQRDIVHPDRKEGAYAVDDFFRRSHFTVKGSDLLGSGSSAIL